MTMTPGKLKLQPLITSCPEYLFEQNLFLIIAESLKQENLN